MWSLHRGTKVKSLLTPTLNKMVPYPWKPRRYSDLIFWQMTTGLLQISNYKSNNCEQGHLFQGSGKQFDLCWKSANSKQQAPADKYHAFQAHEGSPSIWRVIASILTPCQSSRSLVIWTAKHLGTVYELPFKNMISHNVHSYTRFVPPSSVFPLQTSISFAESHAEKYLVQNSAISDF